MLKTLLLGLIAVYRYGISPLTPRSCRYYPSCSSYAKQAIEEHGALKGLWLGIRRFFRCHPWSKHPIYDPVPAKEKVKYINLENNQQDPNKPNA